MKDYVPALVYTMYDGYYIYSPFTNTLSAEDEGKSYKKGDIVYGLKPYVFYSCRYKTGNIDVTITYSLDNYIVVQGKVGNDEVYKAGYLLDNISVSGDRVWYRGVEIETESNLTEQLALYEDSSASTATKRTYNFVKINGVKYYYDSASGKWFSMLNGTRHNLERQFTTENDSAKLYYKEAQEFTEWVRSNLGGLTTSDAVDEKGNKTLSSKFGDGIGIFGNNQGRDKSIEDPDSLFNQHRQAVIRYAIEKNLSIAIANYNNYSGVTANFQMPELKEDEWEKIINNVSVISFLQGLSIGGKIYNGYSIVTNTKTEEVVNIDSIYIATTDGQYHRVTDGELNGSSPINGAFFNVDFERKSITNGTTTTYYYPHEETGCYSSIVSQAGLVSTDNIYKYVGDVGGNLAKYYFTALRKRTI